MRASAVVLLAAAFALPLLACAETLDDLGYDSPTAHPLAPLVGPTRYPNLFREDLGKTATDVDRKVRGAYARLFHGSADESIFEAIGDDLGVIHDTLHMDVRTEGLGIGMLIAVEMGEREDFDRLWNYATMMLQEINGPSAGYFRSWCDTPQGGTAECFDPFGFQQFLTALIFAHDRWGRPSGEGKYELAAQRLLTTLRLKETLNGGRLRGITNTFDRKARLVFNFPDNGGALETRPAIEMPAYYDLWQQATGDPFWGRASVAARAYWQELAHPRTGLMPTRTTFDGTPLAGWADYQAENYRLQMQIALDVLWGGMVGWGVTENERILSFFASQGLQDYGRIYSVDGMTEVDSAHDGSLVAANGFASAVVRASLRKDFVQAVWDAGFPSGTWRYYHGLLQMMALLMLSGQLRVY